MTPQELKNSILQLAIQGKLVEQCPEEGTAEELLVKSRKKPAHNDDSYDIPETWCWALLPDVADILYGFPFNSERFNEAQTGMPIIRIRDIISGQSKTFSDEECDERYRIKRGDMLVGMDGNFQVAFWNSEDAWLNQRVCKITADPFLLNQNYLFFYLPIILAEINGSVSYSTVKHLSAKILNAMLIPLPPLAEQERIVAKIEELLPLIERYEKAWSRLEDFNKRFPVDMQKSILQMAIQGKLVEQRPEEGTGEELYRRIQAEKQALIKAGKLKKEKPLPEITEDEVPFEIPESWKWVHLNDISYLIGDIDHRMPEKVATNGIPYVSPLDFTDDGIDYDHAKQISREDYEMLAKKIKPSRNDIVFPRYGTIGVVRMIKSDRPLLVSYSCCTIKNMQDYVLPVFVFFVLKTPMIQGEINKYINKTTQPNVGLASIKQFLFPLPPLAEQKRIVARLEELLHLCERLK